MAEAERPSLKEPDKGLASSNDSRPWNSGVWVRCELNHCLVRLRCKSCFKAISMAIVRLVIKFPNVHHSPQTPRSATDLVSAGVAATMCAQKGWLMSQYISCMISVTGITSERSLTAKSEDGLRAFLLVACVFFLAFSSSAMFGQALDTGSWPTLGHDNQRTNRGSLVGPSTPDTPQLLYDAGSPVQLGNNIIVTSDNKIVMARCATNVPAIDPSGNTLWTYSLDGTYNESAYGLTASAGGGGPGFRQRLP
jgi:hypothetical protein